MCIAPTLAFSSQAISSKGVRVEPDGAVTIPEDVMRFERWGYTFDGWYTAPDALQPQAGVYVIWCWYGGDMRVLDAGETDDVQARASNHERTGCWSSHCQGTIYYSAIYTPDSQSSARKQIEAQIRSLAGPPCVGDGDADSD